MRLLDHLLGCQTGSVAGHAPLLIAGQQVGWLAPAMVRHLEQWPDLFAPVSAAPAQPDRLPAVQLSAGLTTPEQRSAALAQACVPLTEAGLLPPPGGELYALRADWGQPLLATLDRAHIAAFGVRAYGLHVNGLVDCGDCIKVWIARRAFDRQVEPGKLDNMIAGGQPAGLSLADNLRKEAWEEAGVPPALAATARPVGALRYCMAGERGLKPDTLFLYDLWLPADFVPVNTDGEVESFRLLPLTDLPALLRQENLFKFNVGPVLIDLLIRQGILNPDSEPDYLDVCSRLRAPLP